MNKANPAADNSGNMKTVPQGAEFIDGLPFDTRRGGVVIANGEYYSLASPEAVYGGVESLAAGGPNEVLARRFGRIPIHTATVSTPPTFGAELEGARLDAEGNYAVAPEADQAELYNFVVERGTPPTDSPDELARHYEMLVAELVAEAAADSQYFAPLSVFGQRALGPEDQNTHPYITDVAERMGRVTGFCTAEVFRVGSVQPHTGISDTLAAIRALEAMQYLNPIMTAPSSAGPLLYGGIARHMADHNFTPAQKEHMAQVQIESRDLVGPYASYRYLLRRLGSPLAGTWQAEGPVSIDDYHDEANGALAWGSINSIDRLRGWHTDRVRSVLDQSGNSTLESSAYDTFLGNPKALTSSHLLHSAILTRLVAMGISGEDPRDIVAKGLGMGQLSRQGRLYMAHRVSLCTAREGNDATPYGRQVGTWLPALLRLADDAPHIRLSAEHRQRLADMYAPATAVVKTVAAWRTTHGAECNPIEAYFDTHVGSPSVYLALQHQLLRAKYSAQHKSDPEAEALDTSIARQTERSAAQALHNSMGRMAIAA